MSDDVREDDFCVFCTEIYTLQYFSRSYIQPFAVAYACVFVRFLSIAS